MKSKILPIISLLLLASIIGLIYLYQNNKQILREKENISSVNQDFKEKNNSLLNKIRSLREDVDKKQSRIESLETEKEIYLGRIEKLNEELFNQRIALEKAIEDFRKISRLSYENYNGPDKALIEQLRDQIEFLASERKRFQSDFDSLKSFLEVQTEKYLRTVSIADSMERLNIRNRYLIDSLNNVNMLTSHNLLLKEKKDSFFNYVINNIAIYLEEVKVSEEEGGRKKIKNLTRWRNNKDWKYTTVSFKMVNFSNYPVDSVVFAMKIQNLDNNTFLEVRESYMPESENYNDKVRFGFSDYISELSHHNYEVKEGLNYDLIFIAEFGNQDYVVSGGRFPLIRDGKVVNF